MGKGDTRPIGFFDSGVGGTSIWKEVRELLPNEHTIYLADSANAPYGSKGKERILELSHKNTQLLLKMNCKLIVVACNTATTNAIDELRTHYDIPFIGIEPAIKPAALKTQTNAIGILATEGTLSSSLFHKTSHLFASEIQVVEQVGHGLVPLIEKGQIQSAEMKTLLQQYLQPMLAAQIDHLVLGCSHYPYLIPVLRAMLPENVAIIDSGAAVARQTRAILEKESLLNNSETRGTQQFYTNGDPKVLQELLNADYAVENLDF